MPVGRIVLKSISQSKKLSKLKTHGARLLYTWLIPNLDKNGNFHADPGVVKGLIFTRLPDTVEDIEGYLDDLNNNELIIRYKVGGDVFLNVPDFAERQPGLKPEREGKTTIPDCTPDLILSKSGVNQIKSTQIKLNLIKVKVKSNSPKNFSDEDCRLTQLLIDLMSENDPDSSIIRRLDEERQINWMNACRLLRERDGRSPELIEQIIYFSQNDEFWKANILSMPKLREKFDQLFLKAKKTKFSGIQAWLAEMETKDETE